MKPMGWRFLVAADLGLDAKGPVKIPPGGAEEIRGSLGTAPEAAARGLAFLMNHASGAVEVEALSAPAKELPDRFREQVLEPEMRELRSPPLGMILLDYDFSHQPGDLAALKEMAEMARAIQAPIVAGASPAFFRLRELKLLPKLPDLPQRLADAAHAGWQRFQKEEAARWTVLTVNRWLMRAPAEGEKPEEFLWGRGTWLVGAAAARCARSGGPVLDISGPRAGGFTGLPTRPYFKAANQSVPLSTEIEFPDMAAQELARAGFLPISGRTGSDMVMIPIAVNAYRSSPGRLTVSGTLAYQAAAARLAQHCALLVDEMPRDAAEAAAFLRTSILEMLGPLAGKDPEAAVKVTPVESSDREGKPVKLAEIVVQPDARIEGMEFGLVLQIPLR